MYTMTTAQPGWSVIFSDGRFPVVAWGCDRMGNPMIFYVAGGCLRRTGKPDPIEGWDIPALVFEGQEQPATRAVEANS